MKCDQCPRKCNVDRNLNLGFCGAPENIKIAKYMVHNWEEPIISGGNGSGAIFFSHCNLKCIYCQNWEISSLGKGKEVSVNGLVEIIKELESKNVNNINLVTPTHYTNQIISALKIYRPRVPIVWNSNGYESEEVIKSIQDFVDIYLVDLKYMDSNLALTLSSASDYPEICCRVIKTMRKNQPVDVIDDGIMKKGLIVRHLVLPNEIENSFSVLDWIYSNLGNRTYISIMGQYTPCFKAKDEEKYNRTLKPIEYKRVMNKVENLGFENGFCQDLTSSNTCFIPDFEIFCD